MIVNSQQRHVVCSCLCALFINVYREGILRYWDVQAVGLAYVDAIVVDLPT